MEPGPALHLQIEHKVDRQTGDGVSNYAKNADVTILVPSWQDFIQERIASNHGKRNVGLRKAGLLPVVFPVGDGGDVKGVCVFDASLEDVETIMADDPGVKAEVFTYELHPTRSFPL
jgi:hypothetical protein